MRLAHYLRMDTHLPREISVTGECFMSCECGLFEMFKKLNSGPLKVKERNSLEHLSTHDDIDLMPI